MTGRRGAGEDDAAVRKRRKRPLCNNGNNNNNNNNNHNNLLLPPDVAAVISSSSSSTSTTTDKTLRFNDNITADIDLSLHLYDDDDESTNIDDRNVVHHLYLHSEVLLRGRSQYFSALLSDRWRQRDSSSSSSARYLSITHKVPSSSMKSIDTHMIVIELLYSTDVNFPETINTVSSALSILPVAIELLFEDCVKACIRLIEALPWTEEEEKRVLDLIPLLKEEESQELLSRVKSVSSSSDEMLCRLIQQLRLHHHQRDFVAKMLRGLPSKDSVRFALYHEFEMCFESMNDVLHSVVKSSSESWQTSLLEMVAGHGGYLTWLIGRMIEFRFADTALDRWIYKEGCSLTGNLQKVCSTTDKRISPLHLVHVFECTWKLASAVATGSIVADRQVRMKLVKAWLPVVLCFKDMVSRIMPELLSHEYEKPLFNILSTLPMSESQELLLQCIGFGNPNNVNYLWCPHLEPAYKTWLRRAANQPPKAN